MPELGDVEGFRRLIRRFEGATIEQIDVRDAGILRNRSSAEFVDALVGRQIGRAVRTGKWLRVPVGGLTVLFHFAMTGSLVADEAEVHRHDRVIFATDAGEFRFRDLRKLRGIYVAATADEVNEIVGPLGVDALGISAADLRNRLQPGRSTIKAALIDQTRIAGIGNFLSDEILWRAGVDPRTPTATLTDAQWARLHRSLRTVVRAVARAGHTPRTSRWLTGARWKEPALCPTCGSTLEHGVVATRSSVWCPVCQRTDG
jgi:formamidopyrimidine-DNA glycosylase